MRDAFPTDSEIRKALRVLLPQLSKRYGLSGGCTRAQVEKTVGELAIGKEIVPYVSFATLKKEEWESLRSEMEGINWDEIENRSLRLCRGLLHSRWDNDHFHQMPE